ncbi:MAG: hypothetical protein OXO50_09370 [Caldilineaceae bacterium]|nr:hypothetical protein [Caldilineaceae bacterium]
MEPPQPQIQSQSPGCYGFSGAKGPLQETVPGDYGFDQRIISVSCHSLVRDCEINHKNGLTVNMRVKSATAEDEALLND